MDIDGDGAITLTRLTNKRLLRNSGTCVGRCVKLRRVEDVLTEDDY